VNCLHDALLLQQHAVTFQPGSSSSPVEHASRKRQWVENGQSLEPKRQKPTVIGSLDPKYVIDVSSSDSDDESSMVPSAFTCGVAARVSSQSADLEVRSVCSQSLGTRHSVKETTPVSPKDNNMMCEPSSEASMASKTSYLEPVENQYCSVLPRASSESDNLTLTSAERNIDGNSIQGSQRTRCADTLASAESANITGLTLSSSPTRILTIHETRMLWWGQDHNETIDLTLDSD
jgi:hypothetical protein